MPNDMSVSPTAVNQTHPQYPTIPEPSQDLASLQTALSRLKEGYEMLTGQRGKNEYNLVEGLLSIHKQLGSSTARLLELNEVTVSATAASAKRIEILEAEVGAARDGEPDLSARLTIISEASVDAQADADLALTRFGVVGTINGTSGGFTFIGVLKNDGTSPTYAMEFDVNTFRIRDPATDLNKTVFLYNSGKFEFTGDVSINGNLVITGTIDTLQLANDAVETDKILNNAVSNAASNSGITSSGSTLDVILTTRANANVVIIAAVTNVTATVSNDGNNPNSVVTYGFDVAVDGVVQKSLYSLKTVAQVQNTGGGGYNFYRGVTPVSDHVLVSGLSAGAHTFSIANASGNNVGLALTVIELAK
jgi:hypothetical protein